MYLVLSQESTLESTNAVFHLKATRSLRSLFFIVVRQCILSSPSQNNHSYYQSSYGGNQPSRPVSSETLSSTPSPPAGRAVFWAQKTLKAPEPIRLYCINSAAWRRKQRGLWCPSDLLEAFSLFLRSPNPFL